MLHWLINMSYVSQHSNKTYYEVGAVAKISGLSPHTIRTWERRNFIHAANRSATGRRQYNKEQVDRFVLFKQLTHLGDSISALAGLSLEELQTRLAEFHRVKPTAKANRSIIVKVFTEIAGERLAGLSDRFSLIPAHTNGFYEEETRKPDLLILEVGGTDQAFQIQLNRATAEFPGIPLVLIYDFLQSERLKSFGRQGYFLIKRPIPQELLEQYLMTAAGHRQKLDIESGDESTNEAKPRILTDRQLAAISASTPKVKCECPHHMASLVSSLTAFEDYCARCEIESPEDTILHAHLGKEAAKARHLVEKALIYLCETDQIDISEQTL